MSFIRRLLGGDGTGRDRGGNEPNAHGSDASDADDEERRHERGLLREDDERLSELQRRQLRYADLAWTPPSQGGPRRSDDGIDGGDGSDDA